MRRAAGLTQEQAAERLGITVRALAYIEAGGQNLTLRTMVGIAAVLGRAGRSTYWRRRRRGRSGEAGRQRRSRIAGPHRHRWRGGTARRPAGVA